MKKFFKEFKEFINRGSVMDLAVGLIIGSAFTAIVTALVDSILRPLINWIPGANGTDALKSVLRDAVIDTQGNVVSEAVILDWGAVISAIITFISTAFVLFLIVKALNRLKETGGKVKTVISVKNGKGHATENTEITVVPEAPAQTPEVTVAPVVQEAPSQTTEELLKEIISLIKGDK